MGTVRVFGDHPAGCHCAVKVSSHVFIAKRSIFCIALSLMWMVVQTDATDSNDLGSPVCVSSATDGRTVAEKTQEPTKSYTCNIANSMGRIL